MAVSLLHFGNGPGQVFSPLILAVSGSPTTPQSKWQRDETSRRKLTVTEPKDMARRSLEERKVPRSPQQSESSRAATQATLKAWPPYQAGRPLHGPGRLGSNRAILKRPVEGPCKPETLAPKALPADRTSQGSHPADQPRTSRVCGRHRLGSTMRCPGRSPFTCKLPLLARQAPHSTGCGTRRRRWDQRC
jgi:hypothetical protein